MQANNTPALLGSYELRLCRPHCAGPEDSTSLAIGRLVLSALAIDTATHVRSDSARLALGFTYHEQHKGPPNGCFVWDETGPAYPPSYATTDPGGLIHWNATGDSLFFQLYRSPDAWYRVRAVRTAVGFEGRGASMAGGDSTVGRDRIIGQRLGDPDFSVCDHAANSVWVETQRLEREELGIPERLQN